MELVRTYAKEIDRFYKEEFFSVNDKEKGFVWIAGRSRLFQVLTVEPPEGKEGSGGQYEIAVRFPLDADHPSAGAKYSGYVAGDGWIIGRNTDGH